MSSNKGFAVVTPGLERLLAIEYRRLGIIQPGATNYELKVGEGGITFDLGENYENLYKAALCSAITESIKIRVGEPFHANGVNTIRSSLKKLPWHRFFPKEQFRKHPLRAHVSVVSSGAATVPTQKLQKVVNEVVSDLLNIQIVSKSEVGTQSEDRTEIEDLEEERGDDEIDETDETEEELPQKEDNTTQDQEHLPTIFVRRKSDYVQISLSSTPLLYRRNVDEDKWTVAAPIRETLASAIITQADLKLTGTKDNVPLIVWDPFCGSGTFLIEALRMRAYKGSYFTRPPLLVASRKYKFDFEQWPSHKEKQFEEMRNTLLEQTQEFDRKWKDRPIEYIASDISQRAIDAAQHNFETWKAENDWVNFNFKAVVGDFEEVARQYIPKRDCDPLIVTNPPYGVRLMQDNNKLAFMYKRFSKMLTYRGDIRRTWVLAGSPLFQRKSEQRWKEYHRFRNRGVRVRLIRLVR